MTINKYLLAGIFALFLASSVTAGVPHMNIREVERILLSQKDWIPAIAADFANKTFAELRKLVSVIPPRHDDIAKTDIPGDEGAAPRQLQSIPSSFDARTKWSTCVGPIRAQGNCGSCWAFATAEVFEDRLCIAGRTNGIVKRSPQYLMNCDSNESGCDGGNPRNAWKFVASYGAPTEDCVPYKAVEQTCSRTCANGATLTTRKATSVLSYSSIDSVKSDLMTRGPIETYFAVYNDFYYYKSGIYSPTTSSFAGYHAVKIIGWGVDSNNRQYWIAANSWGTSWGENGFFRIRAGTCEFDTLSHLVAGTV